MGVQTGVRGAGIAVQKLGGDEAFGVDLGDALGADAGVGGLILQEVQGVLDGLAVAFLDLFGDRLGAQRVQRGHAFDRGEGHVVAGDRGGLVAGAAGDEPGQFTLVQGCTAVLFFEHFGGDVGAHLRPYRLVNGGVPVRTEGQVVVAIRLSQALL